MAFTLADLVTQSPFAEMAALLVLAAVVGYLGLLLRQPLIVSFIAVGLMAGPAGLGIARSQEQIELLAELGIAVLLFLVGTKLDVKLIRSLGAVAVTTGLGQVAFTSLFGFLIGLGLGFDWVTSLYVAVALTFSSTIIIVKLLSDKREIDSLHGQVALGFLIVQDLFVVFSMVALSTIGFGAGAGDEAGGGGGALWPILRTVLLAAALLAAVIGFVRYLADPLTGQLARAPELLVTFSIGLTAMLAAVSDAIGLGKEIGGLLAGVALASTPYRETISSRLAPLRDFLLLFFFIALGVHLDLSLIGENLGAAAIFSVFVLVGNPLIVLAIMGAMGYRKRTGFLAGLTVAQISEFSLIFVAMGVSLGHVEGEALGLVTLVGLITIAASTYMITYSHQLYALFAPALGAFERRRALREPQPDEAETAGRFDAVVFGHGRFGSAIAQRLRSAGRRVLCVDFNPVELRRARAEGFAAIFGDASDPAFVADLPLSGARWVIAATPSHAGGVTHDDPRRSLLQALASIGFAGQVAVTVRWATERQALLDAGATLAFEPFEDAADRALEMIEEREAGTVSG
ncbi:MAG: cation:proton antiporter family protein [Rubrimonas sp.]|uniref:cation:proton antiporter n=1 Tax=Rubrimonas sp. TaxID=2036015 RepID=UPI002FDEA890